MVRLGWEEEGIHAMVWEMVTAGCYVVPLPHYRQDVHRYACLVSYEGLVQLEVTTAATRICGRMVLGCRRRFPELWAISVTKTLRSHVDSSR